MKELQMVLFSLNIVLSFCLFGMNLRDKNMQAWLGWLASSFGWMVVILKTL
jgi:hypothetical protein